MGHFAERPPPPDAPLEWPARLTDNGLPNTFKWRPFQVSGDINTPSGGQRRSWGLFMQACLLFIVSAWPTGRSDAGSGRVSPERVFARFGVAGGQPALGLGHEVDSRVPAEPVSRAWHVERVPSEAYV